MKREDTRMDGTRRQLIKTGLSAAAMWAVAAKVTRAAAAEECALTPPQVEGPFYPVSHQLDEDSDLTFVKGGRGLAKGQIAYVEGTVTDEECNPVPGALVEIWQACASGRYNHPADENPAPLDPDFQYWGRTVSDAEGKYAFKTIVPGAYPNDPTWMRPPHIHFKVHKRGFIELTTQMYFAGNRYNEADKIRMRLSPAEQARVTIEPRAPSAGEEASAQVFPFDLSLQRP